MKNIKTISGIILVFLLTAFSTFAQVGSDPVEMDDVMHANGKIYVVVTVLSVVFIGIVVFLVSIDRKVAKLERKLKEKR